MGSLADFCVAFLLIGSMDLIVTTANPNSRRTIELERGPHGVVWVVQLSDLHFSVHHPKRALSFRKLVGKTLAMINPAMVLITGDLTDGKSKDHLTMRLDENEWREYHDTMKDTIAKSGLPEDIFYDLCGNHDKFGVPLPNGRFDFFSQYSISAYLNRTGNVKSITLLNNGWKHLFVGFDSSMTIGLRGPTNLFGHPTDKLISELDVELGQWDMQLSEPVTKIAFGHFPLSFTAATETGKRLEDLFAKHSIAAYLCGHLHTKFGRNLQRHHVQLPPNSKTFQQYFQFNAHDMAIGNNKKQFCSLGNSSIKEFWEWEMGDWRESRIMRIIAIDEGHASFVDVDYKMMSWPLDNTSIAIPTIIVPTFPLDSRMMQRMSSSVAQECRFNNLSFRGSIRALVFSANSIISVKAKLYDSISGKLDLAMEMKMMKHSDTIERGDLYIANWDWKMFMDPSPNRYWLQIEAVEDSGKHAYSQIRPFSVNLKAAPLKWTWQEFWVMGCHWDSLYQPLLWFIFVFLLALLLVPKLLIFYVGNENQFNRWASNILNCKGFGNFLFKIPSWVMLEASRNRPIWWSQLLHLVYLIFFPWFHGQVLVEDFRNGYMSHKGWTVMLPEFMIPQSVIGVPDVLVIVLPHLYLVVFPLLCVVSSLAAEKVVCQMHYLLKSEKKEAKVLVKRTVDTRTSEDSATLNSQLNDAILPSPDLDNVNINRLSTLSSKHCAKACTASCIHCNRWIRKALLGVCFLILWSHWKQSKALVCAYGAKAVLYSPGFVWPVPLLLALAVWKTKNLNYISNA